MSRGQSNAPGRCLELAPQTPASALVIESLDFVAFLVRAIVGPVGAAAPLHLPAGVGCLVLERPVVTRAFARIAALPRHRNFG